MPDPVILEFRYRPADPDADPGTETVDARETLRAEAARHLNAEIYRAGQSLADHRQKEVELSFFCACGCMAEVKRSLREYARRGAVLEGHSRPTAL